jgi:hypothetical protein
LTALPARFPAGPLELVKPCSASDASTAVAATATNSAINGLCSNLIKASLALKLDSWSEPLPDEDTRATARLPPFDFSERALVFVPLVPVAFFAMILDLLSCDLNV